MNSAVAKLWDPDDGAGIIAHEFQPRRGPLSIARFRPLNACLLPSFLSVKTILGVPQIGDRTRLRVGAFAFVTTRGQTPTP